MLEEHVGGERFPTGERERGISPGMREARV